MVKALSVLGLAGINQAISKSPNAIGFAAPISREGAGWRADIDLPPGVTAGDVLERRDRLASGLSRPLGCVWPEPAPHIHPGRLVLWVGDQDIAAAKPAAWPLLRGGQVDAFRPIPFGTDPRGRSVAVSFVYSNMLIGSIPGMGKTFSLRLPLLGLALDPLVRLWAFELKGTGDLEPIAKVAERYASGADDDTAVAEQQRSGPRLVAFYACLYFAGLRPEEAASLNRANLALPARGWGELNIEVAEPHAGREGTDSGKNRDRRQLKQRAVGESRTTPCPPELTAYLHHHISTFGAAADGRLFRGERKGLLHR